MPITTPMSSAQMYFVDHHGPAQSSTRARATQFAIGIGTGFLLFGLCYLCHIGVKHSGVALTMGQQALAGDGFVYAQSGLLVLPSYLGASLAFPFLFRGRQRTVPFHRGFVAIAAFDLLANVVGMTSLVLAGPQIFMLAFSAITALTALLKLVLLRINQSRKQWAALLVIVLGLLLNGKAAAVAGADVEWGTLFGLLAAFLFALCGVIAEGVLTTKNAPPGQALCAFVGLVNSTVITVYVVFYTVPRWRTLVAEPIQAYEGTYRSITLTYLMTTMALLGHQLAFYSLQNLSGAVACSVNKAAQTVSIFIAADFFFCTPEDQRDCFTTTKFESLVAVITGVLAYAIASGKVEQEKNVTEEERAALVQAELDDDYSIANSGSAHFALNEYS